MKGEKQTIFEMDWFLGITNDIYRKPRIYIYIISTTWIYTETIKETQRGNSWDEKKITGTPTFP